MTMEKTKSDQERRSSTIEPQSIKCSVESIPLPPPSPKHHTRTKEYFRKLTFIEGNILASLGRSYTNLGLDGPEKSSSRVGEDADDGDVEEREEGDTEDAILDRGGNGRRSSGRSWTSLGTALLENVVGWRGGDWDDADFVVDDDDAGREKK
jgi:hypothetical protein